MSEMYVGPLSISKIWVYEEIGVRLLRIVTIASTTYLQEWNLYKKFKVRWEYQFGWNCGDTLGTKADADRKARHCSGLIILRLVGGKPRRLIQVSIEKINKNNFKSY